MADEALLVELVVLHMQRGAAGLGPLVAEAEQPHVAVDELPVALDVGCMRRVRVERDAVFVGNAAGRGITHAVEQIAVEIIGTTALVGETGQHVGSELVAYDMDDDLALSEALIVARAQFRRLLRQARLDTGAKDRSVDNAPVTGRGRAFAEDLDPHRIAHMINNETDHVDVAVVAVNVLPRPDQLADVSRCRGRRRQKWSMRPTRPICMQISWRELLL